VPLILSHFGLLRRVDGHAARSVLPAMHWLMSNYKATASMIGSFVGGFGLAVAWVVCFGFGFGFGFGFFWNWNDWFQPRFGLGF
jgi:hypothetical protein